MLNDWLTKLAEEQTTDEAQLESALAELPREELEQILSEHAPVPASPNIDRGKESFMKADQMGRELAHKHGPELAKQAGMLEGAIKAVKPMAGKALGWAAQNPSKAMAAGGAALGAASGLVAPGKDAQGNTKSRLGAALTRGAVGGAAGYGASKLPKGIGQKAMDYTSGAANMGLNRMGQQMKFASASPVERIKLAMYGAMAGEEDSFLSQFEGSPLLQEALQLEQQAIQAEMAHKQQSDERQQMDSQYYSQMDQLRLQKRMLALKAAAEKMGGGAAQEPPHDEMAEAAAAQQEQGAQEAAAPAGPAAGAQGAGSPVAMMKQAMAAKLGFAITEKGHKFDAEKHRMMAGHSGEKAEHLQKYKALAAGGKPASLGAVLRFNHETPSGHPLADARHHEYVAKKHEGGKNAWNPFGGMLTPSSQEKGGTKWNYGAAKAKR